MTTLLFSVGAIACLVLAYSAQARLATAPVTTPAPQHRPVPRPPRHYTEWTLPVRFDGPKLGSVDYLARTFEVCYSGHQTAAVSSVEPGGRRTPIASLGWTPRGAGRVEWVGTSARHALISDGTLAKYWLEQHFRALVEHAVHGRELPQRFIDAMNGRGYCDRLHATGNGRYGYGLPLRRHIPGAPRY